MAYAEHGCDGTILESLVTMMTDQMEREEVLAEAAQLISKDRNESYGGKENLRRTAAGWSTIAGVDITPEQVCLMMAWLKIARLCHASHRDSFVDALGYLALGYECSSDVS